MWNVERFQVMRLPSIWFPHESDQFRCWKPARMYETLHGFLRSIPSYLSMDFVHHDNQTIDVFVAKEYPLSLANFSLRTLFFPSFSKKHLDHRTKKTHQNSCKSGMLLLHFLGFQVELVTEMAIPLLQGSDYYPRCPHVVIAEAL